MANHNLKSYVVTLERCAQGTLQTALYTTWLYAATFSFEIPLLCKLFRHHSTFLSLQTVQGKSEKLFNAVAI